MTEKLLCPKCHAEVNKYKFYYVCPSCKVRAIDAPSCWLYRDLITEFTEDAPEVKTT
jgi:hypothetical protein